ncbi:hypothetical protein GCM10007895_31800 [Paraferrimonas sedimenticola]|uniref:DUF4440 domain-containing protein n=2 Tax=Paraferrimonas sedimenticola TaxID=375674 RepID=A0AA37W2N6_9GAMM|nr:hypothetical protein GCM10007895_31800 [Paraferrimonas sedimenticola]
MLSMSFGYAATKDNNKDLGQLNKAYQITQQSFVDLDLSFVETLYTKDAVYVPGNSKKSTIVGTPAIRASYEEFFSKVKAKQAQVRIDFRVTQRRYHPERVTDVGYYLIEFRPAENSEQPTTHFAGKFVYVFEKQSDGKWQIAVDAASHTDTKHYMSAKPHKDSYYGSAPETINNGWKKKK